MQRGGIRGGAPSSRRSSNQSVFCAGSLEGLSQEIAGAVGQPEAEESERRAARCTSINMSANTCLLSIP